MLESKTNKDIATEQKLAESQLATARARVKEIERLYERIYEDNVNGKVSDEWFMKLSHKYEVEMDETKKNILALREKLDSLAEKLTICPPLHNKRKRAEILLQTTKYRQKNIECSSLSL